MQQASALIRQNDLIIVDGDHGIVIVDPAPIVLEEYSYRQSEKVLEAEQAPAPEVLADATLDGTKIELCANIELPDDAQTAVEAGAMGVGLFRTEFLFMNHKNRLPEEEEQFEAVQARDRADERPAGDHPHHRRRRRQAARLDERRRRLRDRAEPGARPARDPLEPVRAADVHDAVARDPAGVGVRSGEDPDSDARARAGNRSDA